MIGSPGPLATPGLNSPTKYRFAFDVFSGERNLGFLVLLETPTGRLQEH